jgi:hypothetical protein
MPIGQAPSITANVAIASPRAINNQARQSLDRVGSAAMPTQAVGIGKRGGNPILPSWTGALRSVGSVDQTEIELMPPSRDFASREILAAARMSLQMPSSELL